MSGRRIVWPCALAVFATASASASWDTAAGRLRGAGAMISDGPGTETIFLQKGGYGVDVNFLAGSSQTVRMPAVQPMPAAAQGAAGDEHADMLKAIRTAATLTQELEDAARHAEATKEARGKEQDQIAALEEQVSADQKRILAGVQVETARNQFQQQVARLSAELQATKQELLIFKAKDKGLEQQLLAAQNAAVATAQAALQSPRPLAAAVPQPPPAPKITNVGDHKMAGAPSSAQRVPAAARRSKAATVAKKAKAAPKAAKNGKAKAPTKSAVPVEAFEDGAEEQVEPEDAEEVAPMRQAQTGRREMAKKDQDADTDDEAQEADDADVASDASADADSDA